MENDFVYCYQVATRFSSDVTNHSLLLRCQPMACPFQKVREEHVVMPGAFRMSRGTDAYGNRILYGGMREAHSSFAYVSTGIVTQGEYLVPDASPARYYGVESRLTAVSPAMKALTLPQTGTPYERALQIAHEVNTMLQYEPASTGMATTAAMALAQGKGVCQDFAHLMIALCRRNGIMARYVNGFIIGEGETHAWVEVYDGYAWRAIDPTHDTFVFNGYIKLAHGRDALDCTVDRGTFMGTTQQETTISVTVTSIK